MKNDHVFTELMLGMCDSLSSFEIEGKTES